MDYEMTIYLIHVSRRKMIVQGIDGCSWGFLMEGVITGEDMLNFIDLGKTWLSAILRFWTGFAPGQNEMN